MQLDDRAAVDAAVVDKAWQVRLVVAREFGGQARSKRGLAARRLVADINSDVARAAIDAVASWPLAEAGPILLNAMDGRTFLPRKAATERLGAIWQPAVSFEFEAAADRRASAMRELRQQWQSQFAGTITGASAATVGPTRPATISPERLQQVAALLAALDAPDKTQLERHATIRALTEIGAELPSIVERLHEQDSRPLPELLYREVLPRSSPEFAAIEPLNNSDTSSRRQAVDAVCAITRQHPLSSLALERLAALITHETDSLVWSGALTALADDGREPAIRLAYAALGHSATEVRRRGCDYLAAHPEPRHGPLLSISLDDPSPAVVHAAVRDWAIAIARRRAATGKTVVSERP